MLCLTLMWPCEQCPCPDWVLQIKEKVPYGGKTWKQKSHKQLNKEEKKQKLHISWAFGVIRWLAILSTTLQVMRKSREDLSLGLNIKSFGNSLVDLSCVCSYLRFVVLLPCLLPHVTYRLSALFHVCHVILISCGYVPHVCFIVLCFDGLILLDDHPRISVLGFLGPLY